ncbi:MAG: 3D-(3,5/4)-trihydroxycyclohexane-1,2-dione acylhydrolase (decyclizing) [Gammaproteobacteria bacterium]|nr:MAG: 3D-(3,5/4)-trihydroxycyclohexane-1,2-dione acylhydrolase (decyclizing) [Gammaproteobacteria bacterium]
MSTRKLTLAQAMVQHMAAQFAVVDGERLPLFGGVWSIFGHGNVPALGEALYAVRDILPTYRGQNEQGMVHAATAFAKHNRRRRIMACTTSVGPGATNMVTGAATAFVNRLPVLLLPGDVFMHRASAPVLQEVEYPLDASISANDCFKPVSAYWDRLVKPEQIITSLPRAIETMLGADTAGPATLCLPQDVQAEAYDFPERFFAPVEHHLGRLGADMRELDCAADTIRKAKRPLIVAGGGVHYSEACDTLASFAARFGMPVVETSAGKGALAHDDPLNGGAIGVVGVHTANALAAEADLVIGIGTRFSDFTTGSRTVISNGRTPQLSINVAQLDAHKHESQAIRGDAGRSLDELAERLGDYHSDTDWTGRVVEHNGRWQAIVAAAVATSAARNRPSDAQVTQVLNEVANAAEDVLLVAAGSMPAEGAKLWQAGHTRGYHSEYGYSCMGYEIAGGLGVRLAQPEGEIYVVVGDGSYLMLNSDIVTAVAMGLKLTIVVLDNRGFGCINRLQNGCGGAPFNNLWDDGTYAEGNWPRVDFAAHAASMGAVATHVENLEDLKSALLAARDSDRTHCIVIDTNAVDSTGGGAWWQVGIPEVSERREVTAAKSDWQDAGSEKQAY